VQHDLAAMSLMAARANQSGAQQTYAVGQSLLGQLKSAKAVGRLVIDLNAVFKASAGSPGDVELRDGDTLIVPKRSQEVTVMGEVQNVTSHLYSPGLNRDAYIGMSGGLTRQADTKHVYVVRASGSVVAQGAGGMFRHGSADILPGDTIVVPINTDRMPQLAMWQSVTTILYNIAIAVAAVNAL
jgi:polysaccharide biosynthesis/export protein